MSNENIIKILDKFFRGLATEEEHEILRNWIKEPESKDEFSLYYQQCWYLAGDKMDKEEQDKILGNILNRIENFTKNEKKTESKIGARAKSVLRKVMYYAAAACILLIIGFASFHFGKNSITRNTGIITMEVENGQKGDIILADGSKVYLNSDSKIAYDDSYNKKDRILTLEGQAYFEVAKNKEKPFIVQTNGVKIEALGTIFDVKACKTSDLVTVTLIEGKVKVNDFSDERYLNPKERLEYNLTEKSFGKATELLPNANNLLWRSKELAFYGEPLEEICKTLTRMYNCRFRFGSDAIKKYTYTGIIKDGTLKNVLEFLSQTASVKYTIMQDSTIVIY